MALGLIGFFWWVLRTRKLMAWCFLASALLYFYLNASWSCWWFGASFGARAFESVTLFAMLGAAWLLQVSASSKVLHSALLGSLCFFAIWNQNLVLLLDFNRLPWERPVSTAQKLSLTAQFWSGRSR